MKKNSDFRTLKEPFINRFGPLAAALLVAQAGFVTAAPIEQSELVAPKIEIDGGVVEIAVEPSVAGRIYQLQVSDSLTAPSWQNLENEVHGDGNNLSITTAHIPGAPRRFFRLMLTDGSAPIPEGFSLIPAGSFTMGRTSGDTESDAPPVTVTVSAFYMGKYEVTKALFDEVGIWGAANGYTDLRVGGGKASNHPVHSISWFEMVKWCNARSQKDGLTPVYTVDAEVMKTGTTEPTANWSANGYRLPTEAEWEKAARGGVSGKRFPWGTDTISQDQANYRVYSSDGTTNEYSYDVTPRPPATGTDFYHPSYTDGGIPYTSPVGSFAATGYDLYDMAGNVSERCWDWYGESTYVTGATDPRGAASGAGRVRRGAGWRADATGCRAADRVFSTPSFSNSSLGFRLARRSVP